MTDNHPTPDDELEEYILLRETKDPIEAFNLFVKRNCPENLQAHFADNDDNEAEFVRRTIAKLKAREARIETAARIDAVTKIMSAKTEGLFDNGDLFIKRAPIEQAVVDLVGYETYVAIKESLPVTDLAQLKHNPMPDETI